jgi:hypothetical protein
MKPLEKAQSELINHLETIILEQKRRIEKKDREIKSLKIELEIAEETMDYQLHRLIEEYEKKIVNMLEPSLN